MQNRLDKIIEKENFTTFFSHLFTLLGAIFLASGVMFFIAYNWEVLGKFFKFGIVEFAILGSFILAYFLKEESFGFKSAVIVGSFLIGVLLALFGQVYQTGAETYELFIMWALLVLPIALLSRFAGIWLFEIVLINFIIFLYDFSYIEGYYEGYYTSRYIKIDTLFIVNFTILIAWSLFSNHINFLNKKYAIRFIAALATIWGTVAVIQFMIDRHSSPIALLAYMIFMFYMFYRYRVKEIDIQILSILLFSLNLTALSLLVRMNFHDILPILTLGTFIAIGGGFASITWLKNIAGEENEK